MKHEEAVTVTLYDGTPYRVQDDLNDTVDAVERSEWIWSHDQRTMIRCAYVATIGIRLYPEPRNATAPYQACPEFDPHGQECVYPRECALTGLCQLKERDG